jgi:hypothetical protein
MEMPPISIKNTLSNPIGDPPEFRIFAAVPGCGIFVKKRLF